MKIRNKSEEPQHFTGIPTFEAGETREVPDDVGEHLLRSPHIELADGHTVKAVDGHSKKPPRGNVRGVEAE